MVWTSGHKQGPSGSCGQGINSHIHGSGHHTLLYDDHLLWENSCTQIIGVFFFRLLKLYEDPLWDLTLVTHQLFWHKNGFRDLLCPGLRWPCCVFLIRLVGRGSLPSWHRAWVDFCLVPYSPENGKRLRFIHNYDAIMGAWFVLWYWNMMVW